MRTLMILAGVVIASTAAAQEEPTSWMLFLQTETGAAFAPITYEKREECAMVAMKIYAASHGRRPECFPAHFTERQVAEFVAAQKAEIDQARARTSEIARKRPQLEAERQEILSDYMKRNTLRYIERLKEIEALIGPPTN